MMGTGEFALPTFLGLYKSPHQVVGLFTQPDRKGRGHHHHPHPMKDAALERGTPIFQPENVNRSQPLDDLRALNPDVCLVAAYGQILSRDMLAIPKLGAFNIHASLLPKYRGAAPIQYAILNGETETGVTIFRIEPKLDAGPIVGRERLAIGEKETYGELQDRLAEISVPLSQRVLMDLADDRIQIEPQDATQASKAPRLSKQDGEIPWEKSAKQIACHVRAMQPWPSPFTFFHQPGHAPIRLIVTDVNIVDGDAPLWGLGDQNNSEEIPPGAVAFVDQHRLIMETGDGLLEILRLRPQGKREMSTKDFLHGHQIQPGFRMGSEHLS